MRRNSKDFAAWAGDVARMERLAFIDLNELIGKEFDAMGEASVAPMFVSDRVHSTLAGAQLNARVVVTSLKSQGLLTPYLAVNAPAACAPPR